MTIQIMCLLALVVIVAISVLLNMILYSESKFLKYEFRNKLFHARSIFELERRTDEYPNDALAVKCLRDDYRNLYTELQQCGLYKFFELDMSHLDKIIISKENHYSFTNIKKIQFN